MKNKTQNKTTTNSDCTTIIVYMYNTKIVVHLFLTAALINYYAFLGLINTPLLSHTSVSQNHNYSIAQMGPQLKFS